MTGRGFDGDLAVTYGFMPDMNLPPLRLAPSILSADFARLADEVAEVEEHVELLHVDIMDGHYVPNLTIGPVVVRWLRKATTLPFDAHLMISDPRTYGPQFIDAGVDSITFHPETDPKPSDLIDLLHDAGSEVGIAVRPSQSVDDVRGMLDRVEMLLCMTVEPGFAGQAFMPEGLSNIEKAAKLRDEHGLDFRIEVDGGVGPATVARCVAAGADTLVAGSAIFDTPDRAAAAESIRAAAENARRGTEGDRG
jgi:ribulose-phosphate 3-epimerase